MAGSQGHLSPGCVTSESLSRGSFISAPGRLCGWSRARRPGFQCLRGGLDGRPGAHLACSHCCVSVTQDSSPSGVAPPLGALGALRPDALCLVSRSPTSEAACPPQVSTPGQMLVQHRRLCFPCLPRSQKDKRTVSIIREVSACEWAVSLGSGRRGPGLPPAVLDGRGLLAEAPVRGLQMLLIQHQEEAIGW